jgi:sulfur-carrier protein adenylyltransferase/sulfurtransferase
VTSRYDRQTALPEIGVVGQRRLANSSILVIGAGGLGSAALPLLAGAGIGRLLVVDPDVIEEGNLHRQTLYRTSDIGRSKAEVAAESLAALNPDCFVSGRVERIDPVSARGEIAAYDLVIDAADSFAVSYALSDLCFEAGRPLITASVLARRGYVGGFCAGAPSLRAVFPDPPASAQTCSTAGVMGPVVSVLGAMQAQMALSVLLGHSPSPVGQILNVDLATWRTSAFRFEGAPEPSEPFPAVIAASDVSSEDLVVDLRRETAMPRPVRGQRVVFVCTTGLRAWRAAKAMQSSGHVHVAIIGDGA